MPWFSLSPVYLKEYARVSKPASRRRPNFATLMQFCNMLQCNINSPLPRQHFNAQLRGRWYVLLVNAPSS
jgi:hypothetical protein